MGKGGVEIDTAAQIVAVLEDLIKLYSWLNRKPKRGRESQNQKKRHPRTNFREIAKDDVPMGVKNGKSDKQDEMRSEMVGEQDLVVLSFNSS